MATTTNLGLTLPTEGADDDTWGDLNNDVHIGVDAVFKADGTGTSVGLKVGSGKTLNVTGATLTGFPASPIPYGHINGLTLSTAGSSATFGIAAGQAADGTNAALMTLGSAYTKTTSAWALGTAAGALDTGTIANSTWYHVWLIQRSDTSVVDVLVSTSATAPTMPASYDRKRRIGAMKTDGSAQWIKFIQFDDTFLWDAAVSDVSVTNLGTSATLYTLTVPTGVKVEPVISAISRSANVSFGTLLSSPDVSDQAVGAVAGLNSSIHPVANQFVSVVPQALYTNTSAQIRAVADEASTSLRIATRGWVDPRGKR